MRFSAVAIASALVANAYAMGGYYGGYGYVNETVTTEVVTEYTTYCPYATVFTEGVHTYTVTEVDFQCFENALEHVTDSMHAGHHLDHHQLPMHPHLHPLHGVS